MSGVLARVREHRLRLTANPSVGQELQGVGAAHPSSKEFPQHTPWRVVAFVGWYEMDESVSPQTSDCP